MRISQLFFLIIFQTQILLFYAGDFIFNPKPISSIKVSDIDNFTGFYHIVTDDSKWAFVSRNEGGVCIISLEDIQQPQLVKIIKAKGAYEIKIVKNYLFMSDLVEGLVIFDISDIVNPVKIYTLEKQMTAQSVSITKDMKTLFLVSNGIAYCYDITNILSPTFLSSAGVSAPDSYKVKLDETEQLLAIANHVSGFQLIDVRNKTNIKLRATQITGSATWDSYFVPGNAMVYAIDGYFGLFGAALGGILDIPNSEDGLYTLVFQSIYQSPQLTQSVAMTKNGNYLILGFRSIGLRLFEIINGDYTAPVYIQDMDGSYLCNKIQLSPNEKYAFVGNGHSFLVYQSDQPLINSDFPNLFNTFQSSVTAGFNDPWPWEINCFKDNKHIVIAGATDSTFIFSIENPYQPHLISKIPSRNWAAYDGLTLTSSNTQDVLYLGLSELGFFVYDISDLSSPVEKKHIIPSQYYNDADGVQVNSDSSLLIISNGSIGISIYNIKDDRWNPVLVGQFINTGQYKCTFEKCAITKQNDYLFCACREEGVIIFSYEDDSVKPISIVKRVGSEYPVLTTDETHLFVAVGFQGLIILNIQDKLNPKIISTLPLDGWAQTVRFMPMFDNKYMIASQLEKGELVVINVEDYKNPYIFSKIAFPGESSSSFCMTSESKSIFFIGNMGLRYMPMQSGLKIHTQISRLSISKTGKNYYEIFTKGEKLQVGQSVQMVFVPLENTRKVQFSQVFYYRNYEKKNLPSWMTFLYNQQMIQMTVDKEGAYNSFANENKGENIIILQVLKEVLISDFEDSIISNKMAIAISSSLHTQGILSSYNFLDPNFDPNKFAYLDFYNSNIIKDPQTDGHIQSYIKQVLTFSKIDYPIRFFIESSLKFNYLTYLSKDDTLLSTPSYQLIVTFIIKQKGKFIRKLFEGVLTSFSDDLTSVKIEGPSQKVNEIVSSNIQVANFTNNFTDILIQAHISDSSNYDLTFDETLTSFKSFIQLNHPTVLNQNLTLQKQFNRAFDKAVVSVESKFSFTFDLNTFYDEDGQTLTYKAFIITESEENPVEIIQGSGQWIEFNQQSLTLTGMKTIGSFLTRERVRIEASDGFTTVSDQFYMDFNELPLMYTLQLLVQIVGPLIGLFGIWRYRSWIYLQNLQKCFQSILNSFFNNKRMFMKSKYTYSNDSAIVGELYKKQLVLFDEVQQDASKLWKLFLEENKLFQKQLIENYEKEKNINICEIMKQVFLVFDKNQKKFKKLDPREFDFDDSRLTRMIKGYSLLTLFKKDKVTQKALKYLKKQGAKHYTVNDWYKKYVTITPSFEANQYKIISKHSDNISHSVFLKQNANVNQTHANEDIEKNNNAEVETINLDTFNNIFKQRQEEKEEDPNEYKNLNPFPQIKIKEEEIKEELSMNTYKSYDEYLIKEMIIIEASGINFNKFQINPTYGESLILYSHQISHITSYKKDTGCCLGLRKLLKDDYRPIGLNINNPLPKWLKCEIVDGIIHIWGIPKANDEPELLIRIISEFQFTIYSFQIIIKDKEGGELRDKKYVKNKDEQKRKLKNELNLLTENKSKSQQHINIPTIRSETSKPINRQQLNVCKPPMSQFNLYSQNQLKSNLDLNFGAGEESQQMNTQFNSNRELHKIEDTNNNEIKITIQHPSSVMNQSIISIPDENGAKIQLGFISQSSSDPQNDGSSKEKPIQIREKDQTKLQINQILSIAETIKNNSTRAQINNKRNSYTYYNENQS